MKLDPKELSQERLIHPKERTRLGKAPGRGSKLISTLAVVALLLGLGLAYFLFEMNREYETRSQELTDRLEQLTNHIGLLTNRVKQDARVIELLTGNLEVVQQGIGRTQDEVKKAQAQAQALRAEQQQRVEALSLQLGAKADSTRLDQFGQKTEDQFRQVNEDITGVQEELQASRNELEKTWQELAALGVRLTEQGSLVATNSDALEELRRRGERDYHEFDARKRQKITVADIIVELRNADRKRHRADLKLFYDDKEVEQKRIYTNTPVVFYVGPERIQYELVINDVEKDQITGYISVPIGQVSTSQTLRRKSG